jgi:hypothetical protein
MYIVYSTPAKQRKERLGREGRKDYAAIAGKGED